MRIGLFDSGIGGLNVLKEFIKKYPNQEYYYYGDTLNLPYGDKTKEELEKLSLKMLTFFENIKVDLIIIACGTVSSNCYEFLKQKTSIPILDIISPTIKYLKKKNFNKVLLLGTKRTIESHIFKKNIPSIIELSTPKLVPMIESDILENEVIKNYLHEYQDIDALVLGCTHYPLLKNEFLKYLKKDVEIIDMGISLVKELSLEKESTLKIELYFTKIDDTLKKNIAKIIKVPYSITLL